MKRLFFSCLTLLSLTSLVSCREELVIGSGPTSTEQRSVTGNFSKIHISAPVDAEIEVREGAAPAVQVDGYSNILKHIRFETKDGVLRIYVPDDINLRTEKNVVAHIILPSLSELDVSGAADANIRGQVTGRQLDVDLSGAGNISAENINVSELNVDLSGAATFSAAAGRATRASFGISGAGEVEAFGLQTDETTVEVSGSGSVQVTAHKSLNAEISGSGDVAYKGHPAISKDISGAGSITDAN